MLNKFDKVLLSNFGLIPLSTLFIISLFLTIHNFTKKTKKRSLKDSFIQNLLPLLFCFCLGLAIYHILKFNYDGVMKQGVVSIIEIFSVGFAVGKERVNSFLKLLGTVFFILCVLTISFSLVGIFEQYLGYEELQNSDLEFLFAAFFYHLINVCFLVYAFLPKERVVSIF